MIRNLFLRVNGRGNAWPVPLGQEHPFYSRPGIPDYANASFSLLIKDLDEHILTDILIDAGHGIIPFLLSHENRIPEAIVITHPHFDHILGMDWIIQSYYRFRGKKPYPVYTTRGCRQQILDTLPHLASLAVFHELGYGKTVPVSETEGLTVTAYPVYHGPHARGAAMLLFEWKASGKRIVFTGDLLFPLLRKSDIGHLQGIDWLIADANNRFPYPESNHWSVVRSEPEDHQYLLPWFGELTTDQVMLPHQYQGYREYNYLLKCFQDFPSAKMQPLTVSNLVRRLSPSNLILTHYSGLEDAKYYGEKLLDVQGLEKWGQQMMEKAGVTVKVMVPHTGEILKLERD
ncbi:MAG: MBL fold metallo-hydrolase [Chlorobi bacterium]|nr:MBL fold metallo-hydrolase [Chlorobiota bacterium]